MLKSIYMYRDAPVGRPAQLWCKRVQDGLLAGREIAL